MDKILSYARRCIEDYDMIQAGDRVAVGVSGGKDSIVLLAALARLREFYPKPFTVEAFTLDMGHVDGGVGMDFTPVADYCAAAGWTYVTQWLRMQIYCTDRSDAVPLETDEERKLETVRAVFRKDLRRNLFLLAVYLLNCFLMAKNVSLNPLGYLASPMALLYFTGWPALVLLTVKSLLSWAIWLRPRMSRCIRWLKPRI